jgi:hypothetical protein
MWGRREEGLAAISEAIKIQHRVGQRPDAFLPKSP